MVEFLCKVYKSFVNVISIIALFVMPIIGFVFFGKIFGEWEFNYGMAFLGGIIGFAGCFIFELLTIPPLMILFSIDSKFEKLIKENGTNDDEEDEIIMETPVWICEACETENSGEICSNCGAKKSKIIV